jgi:peroxiredoxin
MSINRVFLLIAALAWTAVSNGFHLAATTTRSNQVVSDLKMIAVGDAAPDFSLSTASGSVVKLSSFKGKKPVVVFFYPADNTPGCTKEACAFERKAPDFKALGAEIIGISSGKKEDKEKFIRANKLNNMQLLIDAGDVARFVTHTDYVHTIELCCITSVA